MAVSSGVYIDALAVAQDGSVMIAGTYFGPVDFGGGLLTAVASSDAQSFLAKYGPSGAHLWSRWVGPGARNLVLAVDAEGDTYVGGQLDGTIDLGAGPLTAPPRHARAWIAKLGPSGVPLWSLVTNGEERERDISATRVHAIAIDAGGNLVVNGTFIYTAVDFGEGVGVEYRCCGDNSFLTTIDAAGKPLWARWIGGYGVSANVDIGAGGLGLVLVTSSFQGFKVSHLDGSGFEQSSLTFARDTYLWVRGAAVDAWGAVLVTGAFRGTLDLGQGPMQTSALSDFDGYVAKLGP
jgi:hypothetical protein